MNLWRHRLSQNMNQRISALCPMQKSLQFLVHILGETMTSEIHAEIYWPLATCQLQSEQKVCQFHSFCILNSFLIALCGFLLPLTCTLHATMTFYGNFVCPPWKSVAHKAIFLSMKLTKFLKKFNQLERIVNKRPWSFLISQNWVFSICLYTL